MKVGVALKFMGDFSIKKGTNTPAVNFTASSTTLVICGKSYPENAGEFYDEVFNKINPFTNSKSFTFELDFEYLSSSSVVCVLEKLKNLKAKFPTTNFLIKFHYESDDEDMLSVAENYEKFSGIKVELVVK